MRLFLLVIFSALLVSGSVGQAAEITINPGESISVNPSHSTTITCSGSSGGGSTNKGSCQNGPSSCIGLQPGAMCGIKNGVKSYCVKVTHDHYGYHGCSCDS